MMPLHSFFDIWASTDLLRSMSATSARACKRLGSSCGWELELYVVASTEPILPLVPRCGRWSGWHSLTYNTGEKNPIRSYWPICHGRPTKNLGIQNANQATIQEFLGSSLLAPSSPWSRYPRLKSSKRARFAPTRSTPFLKWNLLGLYKPGAKLETCHQIWKHGCNMIQLQLTKRPNCQRTLPEHP